MLIAGRVSQRHSVRLSPLRQKTPHTDRKETQAQEIFRTNASNQDEKAKECVLLERDKLQLSLMEKTQRE
jgi:hypothetical protein